jgi:hypothetical protein
VQTQLRQGCSFGRAEREIGMTGANHDIEYFRSQFMQDIQRSQPAIVVDSTGLNDSTYKTREIAAHEVFPAFATFLDRDYEALGEFFNFRFYLRKTPTVASG